jgi:hydrogenase maturation protease
MKPTEAIYLGSEGRASIVPQSLPTLVVGIGSPHGDDQAGWEVVKQLSDRLMAEFTFRKASVPHAILDWLHSELNVHIVDASLDSEPGVRRYSIRPQPDQSLQITQRQTVNADFVEMAFPDVRSSSSHQLGLVSVLQLASTLGKLPSQFTLWTVSIDQSYKNDGMAPGTASLVSECARQIESEMQNA